MFKNNYNIKSAKVFWCELNSNYSKLIRISSEGVWIVIGQIVSVLGSLALVKVLTLLLEPSQYGQLALGLTIAGLTNQIILGGISGAIARFYPVSMEEHDFHSYYKEALRLYIYAIFLIITLGIITVAGLINMGHAEWGVLAGVMLCYAIISGINSTLSGIQNAARQRSVVALTSGVDSWLKVIFSYVLLIVLESSSTNVAMAYLISITITSVIQYKLFKKLIIVSDNKISSCSGSKNWKVRIWTYAWPFSAWGIFTWGQQASDKWALAFYGTTDEVGSFAVLWQLGFVPISLFSGFLISLIAPIFYQWAGDASDSLRITRVYNITGKLSWLVLLLSLIAAILANFYHDVIFKVLASSKFIEVSEWLPYIIIAAGFQTSHHILGIRISAMLKVTSLVFPQIGSALMMISLNILGVYLGGLPGLIYAIVVASFLYYLWMALLSKTILQKSFSA